jgi:hypothetical protein
VNGPTTAPLAAGVSGINGGTFGFGVRGEHKGVGYGVYGTAPQVGVGGESANIGVLGIAPIAMKAQGNAIQTMGSFGWAKAMVHVRGTSILKCFNSQTTNPALVQANGCGFRITGNSIAFESRNITIDFGFNVSDSFPSLTIGANRTCQGDQSSGQCAGTAITSGNTVSVQISDLDDDAVGFWDFYLILF